LDLNASVQWMMTISIWYYFPLGRISATDTQNLYTGQERGSALRYDDILFDIPEKYQFPYPHCQVQVRLIIPVIPVASSRTR
jgi:hypothetical protein